MTPITTASTCDSHHHCPLPSPHSTVPYHLLTPLFPTTSSLHCSLPSPHSTVPYHLLTPLFATISSLHCPLPSPHSTVPYHLLTPLFPTTSSLHCSLPSPHSTVPYHLLTPLFATISSLHCSLPSPHSTVHYHLLTPLFPVHCHHMLPLLYLSLCRLVVIDLYLKRLEVASRDTVCFPVAPCKDLSSLVHVRVAIVSIFKYHCLIKLQVTFRIAISTYAWQGPILFLK